MHLREMVFGVVNAKKGWWGRYRSLSQSREESKRPAARARLLLLLNRPAGPGLETRLPKTTRDAADRPGDQTPSAEPRVCPCCREGHLIHIGRLYPKQASGP